MKVSRSHFTVRKIVFHILIFYEAHASFQDKNEEEDEEVSTE